VFTLGCNLRCRFCHNPEFVLPEKVARIKDWLRQEQAFFEFLEKRHGILDGVSVCGGEPTIHRDLKQFLARIQELGFLVKLDTNGRNPEVLAELIEEWLVNYIAMDVKHTWEKYPTLTWVQGDASSYQESIRIIMETAPDYEFRTTVIKGTHTSNDIEDIARSIDGVRRYYLQNYHSWDILDPSFSGTSFTHEELLEMQKQALLYVKECGIRE
jgi:pyruvate formate lyase activating enzyme